MNNDLTTHIGDDRFAQHVGISLITVEPGYASAKMEIRDFHMNGVNRVQGGAIFTLADYAFAAASNTKGHMTLGVNTSISYFKSPRGSFITAEAKELSSGSKICGFNVDVFDEDKELIARMSCIGYIKNRT